MAVEVNCAGCHAKFQADERHAGKRTKCPKCQQPLVIPTVNSVARVAAAPVGAKVQATAAEAPKPVTPTAPPKLDRQQISQSLQKGFQGPIKRSRPSIMYLLSAMLVAFVMILLPIVYIAFIGLVGYGVYYHAVNHVGMITAGHVRGRGILFVFLAYLAPIVCGAIAIVFMIKPLFAGRAMHTRTRSLAREREPLLFAFVDRICETVGSPRPKRIDLDCQVNASARFRRGMLSMLGNDLVLTIGMPLVAGLNTRQFAGVLAHEFGHFSQGAGMRLSYIIRSISFWFARVVYQRDAADQWLQTTAQSIDIRLGWVLYLASIFVWFTRRVLWCFMQVGNVIGSHLLRQMEFDADRYEIRLAGSEAFIQTAKQLQYLNASMQAAFNDLDDFYREGRLGDDLPQLIMSRAAEIPPALVKIIDNHMATTSTGWLDSHPSDKDRIAQAWKESAPGVFTVEMPATNLLSDFTAQSKATTWEFYREIFGNKLHSDKLRPISEVVAKREHHQAARGALDRFFVGGWNIAEPLLARHDASRPPANPQAALKNLKQTRQQMEAIAEATLPYFEKLSNSLGEAIAAKQLLVCVRAGMKVTYNKKRLSKRDEDQIKKQREAAERQVRLARHHIAPYQKLATERMVLGLQLFHVAQVAQRIPQHAQWAKKLHARFECFLIVGDQLQSFVEIVEKSAAYNMLVQELMANNQNEEVFRAVQGLTRELHTLVQRMRSAFQNFKYPYDHATKELSLSNFLIPEVPMKDDIGSVYQAANQLVESVPALYERLLGDMALIAIAVETAVGIEKAPAAEATDAAVAALLN